MQEAPPSQCSIRTGVYEAPDGKRVIVRYIGKDEYSKEPWVAYEDEGQGLFCPEKSFVRRGFVPIKYITHGHMDIKEIMRERPLRKKSSLSWLWEGK